MFLLLSEEGFGTKQSIGCIGMKINKNGCDYCKNGEFDEYIFPNYGLPPHRHNLSKTGSFIGSTVFTPEKIDEHMTIHEDGMCTYFCPTNGCPNSKAMRTK